MTRFQAIQVTVSTTYTAPVRESHLRFTTDESFFTEQFTVRRVRDTVRESKVTIHTDRNRDNFLSKYFLSERLNV